MTSILNFVESLPTTLPFGIDLVLRATIILAIAQLIAHAVRRHSAATRHFVVTLGLAAVVALPLFMIALPDARLEVLPAVSTQPDSSATTAADTNRGTWKSGDDNAGAASRDGIAEVERTIQATGIADHRAVTVANVILWVGENWPSFLLASLTLIPAVLLGRLLLGMIAVMVVARKAEPADDRWMQLELSRAARRLSVARPIRMLLSDRINVPLVWGFVRPVLILPSSALNWSRDRFRVVVLHEVAHVRRFDVLSLMTGRLATALYWFHPLSWVLERTGRRECERACDDLVLRSGARASDYADHLLGIAAGEDLAESYSSVTLAMARPSELEGRLVSILRAESERAPVSRRVASIAAAAAFVMLLPIASVRLTAKPVDTSNPVVSQSVAIATSPVSVSEPVAEVSEAAVVDPTVAIGVSDGLEPVVLAQFETSSFEFQEKQETNVVTVKNRQDKEYDSEGEKWFQMAYEYHNEDRYDEAIAAFKKAAALGYRVGTSMYNIGCGYAMKGDVDNAVRWIEDAFKNGFDKMETVEKDSDLDPIRSDPRFRGLIRDLRAEHGRSARKDRFDEARARFAELRAASSTDSGEWADIGVDLLRLRELDDAIYSLQQAVRLEPEYSSTARYNLACAYAIKGESSNALRSLEEAILNGFESDDKIAHDPDLDSIRGEPRFKQLRVMNDDLSLWDGVRNEKKFGKWNEDSAFHESLPRFESAVTKYPDSGRAWFNLGFAALRAGNTDRARTAFERSLNLDYKRATSMYNLACVEAIAGRTDAAFNWLYESEKAGGRLGNLRHDDDLNSLHGDPRFDELLERTMKRKDMDKERIEEKTRQKKKEAGWI